MRVLTENNEIYYNPPAELIEDYSYLFGKKRKKRPLKKIGKKIKNAGAKIKNKVKKVGQKVKKGVKNVGKKIKKGMGAPARKAFLTLIKNNFSGLATKIIQVQSKSPDKWNKVLSIWQKAGGTIGDLNNSVNIGKTKKPIMSLPKKKSSFEGFDQDEVDGIQSSISGGEAAGIAATLAIAAPIAIPILGVLGLVALARKFGIGAGGGTSYSEEDLLGDDELRQGEEDEYGQEEEYDTEEDGELEDGELPEEQVEDDTEADTPSALKKSSVKTPSVKSSKDIVAKKNLELNDSQDKKPMNKWLKWGLIGAGILVVVGGTILIIKNKKKK